MSAGKFVDQTYSTDGGLLCPIRVQPETVTAWNILPVGAVAPGTPSARATGGRNKAGINARIARFRWSGSPPAAPTGYDPNGIITLPILTNAAFQTLVKNTSYAYLGAALNLVGKTSEKVR